MILFIMSIYDSKAEQHLPPITIPKIDMALRVFADAVNEPGHAYYRNPGDYTIFHHGDFDADNGTFNILDAKQSYGNGVDFQRPRAQLEIPI